MFDETKVITAIRAPVLWLHCCSDPRRCSVFLIPQTGTFCRCEFLSDSGGDKHSELVIAVPWVGVCLLWNIQMSFFFQPLLLPIFSSSVIPLSLYSCHSASLATNYQSFHCLLSSIFSLPSLIVTFFLSFLLFFSAILSLSLCLFDVSAALTQTCSRLNSLWMIMEFLDCGCMWFARICEWCVYMWMNAFAVHARICVCENLLLLVCREVLDFSLINSKKTKRKTSFSFYL